MNNLKQQIMLRVWAVRLMRPLVSDSAAAIVLFLIALYEIGREVWVAQVWANMPSVFDVAAVANFAVSAFLNTEFIVQVFVVIALGAMLWGVRKIALSIADLSSQTRTV